MIRRLLPVALLALLVPASADAAGARTTLHKASAALTTRAPAHESRNVTPLLKQLAVKLPSLHGAERTKAARLLARPTIGQGAPGELEYEVSEATPLCSEHYCIHYVRSTDDRPSLKDANANGVPDYVETMDAVFEHVYAVENRELGWNPPAADKLALLARLVDLDGGQAEVRAEIVGLAADRFPDDPRLRGLVSAGLPRGA